MKEKTHSFERIINGSEEDKQVASDTLQEIYDSKSGSFEGYELEKTPEDLETIRIVESLVDKKVSECGGKVKSVPIDHIFILKLGSIQKITNGRLVGGIHQPMGSKIGVERGESQLLFASSIAHELFHSKSYKAARIGKSADDIRLYRSGIQMYDMKNPDDKYGEEKSYFGEMEEAIVAECTRKLLNELSKEYILKEETEAVNILTGWMTGYYRHMGIPEDQINMFEMELKYIPNAQSRVKQVIAFSDDEKKRQAYAAGMFEALYKQKRVEMVERYRERTKLYKILDKLLVDSGGMFKNREEIFNVFAKANFTGNYLPLARIIEKILGKGSFRKLAEEFSEQVEKII
ncbi:MAG: hypothetical protein Q7K65_00390 [Candidatus Buchananbacteria bacterium]|nr:hypothetical protein [Candidatus Buchananbacteria bacterium]